MVLDAWTYTSNLDLSSPPAAYREVHNPSVGDLLQKIRMTTNRDAAANLNTSDLSENPPVDNQWDNLPGGDSFASSEHGSPTGSGGGSESDGISGISASGATSRDGRGSRGGSASCGGRNARGGPGGTARRGGRGDCTPQRPITRSVAQAPNARTNSELRRLAYITKREFPDIAHKDDPV